MVASHRHLAGGLLPSLAAAWLALAATSLAAEPTINEFVADNKNGLADEDGAEVDWLEIYNPNPIAFDLTGYYLTDDASEPTKWAFPAVSVNANGYLVVFASGKDRRIPGDNLHTNFSLRAAGEELLLVNPDGITVVSQFTFGPQSQDVSYGATAVTASAVTLIGPQAAARALVPFSDVLGDTWTEPGFDDSTWAAGVTEVGYEDSAGYENLIGLDVGPLMSGANTTCFIRVPFPATDSTAALSLTLRMRYDDGFAVYLNGTLLPTAARNAPGNLPWDAEATTDHDDSEAVQYEDISLTQHLGLLSDASPNVLAVHGLNNGLGSSDFLIGPQLLLTRGNFSVGFMTQPTPGLPNSQGVQGLVADTKFSADRGFYTAPVNVAITCATPDAEIRYTQNGDSPTATTGFVYTAPILIDGTTVLRAAAFRDGWQPSNVDTHSYFFLDDVVIQSADGSAPAGWPARSINSQRFNYGMDPEVINLATPATMKLALEAIPTISLVTDLANLNDPDTGIYVNAGEQGAAAERPVSLEILNDPLNPGPNGFQQNGGLRIRGGFSRDPLNPKHSFRLFFRSSYGKGKMDYPLFGDGLPAKFDSFDLRTSQDVSWSFEGSSQNTFLRDEASRALQVEIMPGSRVRYVHVYLNGQYWGLYNTDERPNKGYGEQYFGGKEDDYDVIKSSGFPGGHTTEATDGTMEIGSGWHQLWSGALAVQDNPTNENYFKLMGRATDGVTPTIDPVVLDAVNLIDYMLVLFYVGASDGPISDFVGASNNWFGFRNRNGTDGFRFFVHDFEQTLGLGSATDQRVGEGAEIRPWSDVVNGLFDYDRSNPHFIHESLAWNLEYRVLFGDRAHLHLFNNGAMTDANVLALINALAAQIDTAIWAESARWGDSVTSTPFVRQDWLDANQDVFSFVTSGTSDSGGTGRVNEIIRQLRGYDDGTKRLYPLVAAPAFSQHGGDIPAGGVAVSITQSNGGSPILYYTTDGSDPRAVGGNVATSALTYSDPVMIDAWTTTLKSRVKLGADWSALNEAVFTRDTGLPPLAVMEIHAIPAKPDSTESAAGFSDKEDFEFIELMNTGSEMLNLRDIRGTRGIAFTLTDTFLAPGERAVVVHRLAAFRQRYGLGPRVAGTYTGSLSDGGERLTLSAASGAVLTDFAYDTNAPWPDSAGLTGYSLTRRSADLAPALPGSWRGSVLSGGSPGGVDNTTYAAWKTSNGITDDREDVDGDGLLPLAEYASGGSPVESDVARQPAISQAGDPPSVVFAFTRRRAADDLTAEVQSSSDLVTWLPAAGEILSITALDDGTEVIEFGTSPVTSPGDAVFLRLLWRAAE